MHDVSVNLEVCDSASYFGFLFDIRLFIIIFIFNFADQYNPSDLVRARVSRNIVRCRYGSAAEVMSEAR